MVRACENIYIECTECQWDWTGPADGQSVWHECNQGNREFKLPKSKVIKLKEIK